jgi:cytochrome c oxidase subunit 2
VWLAVLVVAGAVGCSNDVTPSTLKPAGSQADRLATLWWVLLSMATVVFIVVGGFIAFAAASNRRANPGGWSDHRFIVVGGVVVPFVILSVVASLTVIDSRDLANAGTGKPVRIEVTGRRWWWEVRYLDTGFVTANEMRVPVGRPIQVTVKSDDVIHSFWVPQLAGKTDTIPGQPNQMVFDVSKPGTYFGNCAEFCGIQHTNMAVVVDALSDRDFDRWESEHRTPSRPKGANATAGRTVFEEQACAGCHTVSGTSARGDVGPNLSDFGERKTIGAGAFLNDPAHLAEWLRDTQRVKPGALMPTLDLTNTQIRQLVAYLEELK